MILDIASLLLELYGLFADSKKKESREERIAMLKATLGKANYFYKLLSDAKAVHDCFESLSAIAIEPLLKSVKNRRLALKSMEQHADTFLKHVERFTTLPQLERSTPAARPDATAGKNASLPVEIRNRVHGLETDYPKMSQAVSDFHAAVVEFAALAKVRNYGESFEKCIVLIGHSSDVATSNADRVLVHAAVLVDSLHARMSEQIQEL